MISVCRSDEFTDNGRRSPEGCQRSPLLRVAANAGAAGDPLPPRCLDNCANNRDMTHTKYGSIP